MVHSYIYVLLDFRNTNLVGGWEYSYHRIRYYCMGILHCEKACSPSVDGVRSRRAKRSLMARMQNLSGNWLCVWLGQFAPSTVCLHGTGGCASCRDGK